MRIIRGTVPPDILIDVVGSVYERTGRAECLAPTVEGVRVVILGEILGVGDIVFETKIGA